MPSPAAEPLSHSPPRYLYDDGIDDVVLEELKVGVSEPVLDVLAPASEQVVQHVHDVALSSQDTPHDDTTHQHRYAGNRTTARKETISQR